MNNPIQDQVERILPLIREHAEAAERDRRLSPAVVDAMRDAGLFRMFLPVQYGGAEVSLADGLEVIERIAQVDSAAAWNLQIAAVNAATTGALLPTEGADEIFADPNAIVAGGFNPPGAAVPVEGGYRLTGRWPFASGCQHATWFADPAFVMRDGQPEMGEHGPVMVVLTYRAEEAEILETWNPLGMRGTGSHDIAAANVFVPARRATLLRPFDDLPPAFQGPVYKLGLMPTILANPVVALGIARAAIDEAVSMIGSKVAGFVQTRPVDRGVVHMHLGRAEAELGAARAYFYTAIDRAWQAALAEQRPTVPQRLDMQLAASQAAEGAARAVDHVHAAVGSSGMREEQHQFARHFRDVHTITQHALCSATRFEDMGQVMLGLEKDWELFDL
jgi:alkylation response protein AidB-like acyl-CoA dehydrogenase